ncbi:MAG: hypothetical protein J6Z22_11135 [Lachnospiraceae bacterium]|nr:hypothetical protein [Lachnospiraceae bacterium]
MEIVIKRDSVSKADVADHTLKIEVSSSTSYEDIIKQLGAMNYFPDMPGQHPVWVLRHPRHAPIASYYSQDKVCFPGLQTRSITAYGDEFRFVYYPDPERWEIAILDFYDGSGYAAWHEGWGKEMQFIGQLKK